MRNTGAAATPNPPTRHGPHLLAAAYSSFDLSHSASTFWSDEELAWFGPAGKDATRWAIDLYLGLQRGRHNVEQFCAVLPMLRARFPSQLPASHFTCEGFGKIVTMYGSRAVSLQSRTVFSLQAMIPYHWMIDHAPTGTCNTVNRYPVWGKPSYQNVAGAGGVKRGELLTVAYHPKMSNAEALVEYDFVHSPFIDPLGNWVPLLVTDLLQAVRDCYYDHTSKSTAVEERPPPTAAMEKDAHAAVSVAFTQCGAGGAGGDGKYGGGSGSTAVVRAFNTTTTAPAVPGADQAVYVFQRGVLGVIAVAVSRNPAETLRSVLAGTVGAGKTAVVGLGGERGGLKDGGGGGGGGGNRGKSGTGGKGGKGGGKGGEGSRCNPILPYALEQWRGTGSTNLTSVAADIVVRWLQITVVRIEAWLRSASPALSTPSYRVRGVRQIAQERVRICKRAMRLLGDNGVA